MEMYDILARAFERLAGFDFDKTFDDIDEKQLEREVEKMVDFMSTKIEDIRTVEVKGISVDFLKNVVEVVFVFTAPNITIEDNRCYSIKLNY